MNDERLEEGPKRPLGASRNGWLMMLFGWSMAFFLVTFFYWSLLDHQSNPNRMSVISRQGGDLVLEKNDSNQYVAEGLINGTKVVFLLDTGATHIAVPVAGRRKGQPLAPQRARHPNPPPAKRPATRPEISSVQLGPPSSSATSADSSFRPVHAGRCRPPRHERPRRPLLLTGRRPSDHQNPRPQRNLTGGGQTQ